MDNKNFLEQQFLYNKMFNALVTNIYSKSKNLQGRINQVNINFFDPDNVQHQVMLFAANAATVIKGGDIYLNMPLIKFIKWKWPRRKTHKNVHWLHKVDISSHGLNPEEELTYISKAFEVDQQIWEDIYNDFFRYNPAEDVDDMDGDE